MTGPEEHPRHASAAARPCEMYAPSGHGTCRPSRTQGHHIHPQYLQKRAWGQVRDTQLLWLCGTCHDNVHAWLDWLLGEAYQPPVPPARNRKLAEQTLAWFDSVKPKPPPPA